MRKRNVCPACSGANGITTTRAVGATVSPTLIFDAIISAPLISCACNSSPVSRNTRRRMTGHAALANYIRVAIHPGTRFRVVVVQAERVSVWLLQEVDNLAVLMCTLGQPFL